MPLKLDASTISLIIGLILTAWNIIDRIANKGVQSANVSNSLDVLKAGNASIQNTLDKMDKKQEEHTERITRVEESCKSAHHRIDGLEVRGRDGN